MTPYFEDVSRGCFFFTKKLCLTVNLFLMIKNAYQMLPMKIFQKNIQTEDVFLLEPEIVK